MKKGKLINSFKYALEGLFYSIKNERNIFIHFIIMILVISFGLIFKIKLYEWFICIILFILVISLEFINTSIELTLDVICEEKRKKIKDAKDIAAASVLISAMGASIIGLLIFIPKILNLI